MLPQGLRELLERRQPRAHRHGRPSLEEATPAVDGRVGPEVLELFLEEVGADGAEVDGDEIAEANALFAGEVLGPLEEEPSGLGEDDLEGDRRAVEKPSLPPQYRNEVVR